MPQRKKILVTGGAGFIGSHTVVDLYHAGYEPIILDNFSNSNSSVLGRIEQILGASVKAYEYDCTNLQDVISVFEQEENIQGVIHFAAFKAVNESVEQPIKYYYNNLNSLNVLLAVMQQFGVTDMVFSSSCTVYGNPDTISVTEQAPIKNAESPYGHTKQLCEDILQRVKPTVSSVILRYFNPIGAHPSGLIGELPLGTPSNLAPYITQTAAGIREKLTIFGNDYNTADGTCIRDFIHVVDLAKAHVAALKLIEKSSKPFLDVFNLGTGKGHTVLELVKAFETITGVKIKYTFGKRRAGDVEGIYADCTKANNILGWKTELTIEDAMQNAWQWQQNLK
ncbi:MAG: UDP-glucose 4-epimerase GalE [Bacteroidia bacterium]